MKNLTWLLATESKAMQNYLIICAGSTVACYRRQIQSYINRTKPIVIGVNNVSHLFKLDYHLWTNFNRFKVFYSADCENLILSKHLYGKLCEKKLFGFGETYMSDDVELINDNVSLWRTAGIRAIQYVYDNNGFAWIVGMDGYTLKFNGNQHCYGTGDTDSDNEEFCKNKDSIMRDNMLRMKNEGVKFNILTPTVFSDHFDGTVLNTKEVLCENS